MNLEHIKRYLPYIIAACIIGFSILAFYIRIIPATHVGSGDILNFVGMDDPMYNLRQVELTLKNFPAFGWFDPMTLMPYGQIPHWGPMFIWIISFACVLTGAVSQPDIIRVALLIPPIMAACIVPIAYYIGSKIKDWKTGLLSALFVAIIGGQHLTRSLYGYVDHHTAEILFGGLFCLIYIYALIETKDLKINIKNFSTMKKSILLACIVGFTYMIGFLVMPTMVWFALIVGLYTIIQFILDYYYHKKSEYLLILNSVSFAVVIALFFAIGFPVVTFVTLAHYSIAHVMMYAALIGVTFLLYIIKNNTSTLRGFITTLAVISGLAFVAFAMSLNQLYYIAIESIYGFFGQSTYAVTVQEARMWTLTDAWNSYNFAFPLALVGIGILLYYIVKYKRHEHIFFGIWSIIALISTIQHIRYEYYLAINVSILSAIAVIFCIEKSLPHIKKLKTKNQETEKLPITKKNKKAKVEPKDNTNVGILATSILSIVSILAILFIVTSISFGIGIANSDPIRLNGDWKESLVWMGNNTPNTGVDYYKIYPYQEIYHYPKGTYGVMSWWDYGHMITYIAHRIPNANPFQAGVKGNASSSSFFMAEDEQKSTQILDELRTKYVMTDIEMATGKFWAMATWYNEQLGASPYIGMFMIQNPQTQQTQQAMVYSQAFFRTMITRLHIYDGSMINSNAAVYIEYDIASGVPTIRIAEQLSLQDAINRTKQKNMYGRSTGIISPEVTFPIGKVPALKHYRLVHESPSSTITGNGFDVKYVKTFEYVKGAEIIGEGIIETTVTTNTGRQFIYRQESENGKFVVPYPGTYKISGTNQTTIIKEEQIK